MKIIFCEECGSRNVIGDDALRNIDAKAYPCQVCGFNISTKHLIDHTGAGRVINTSNYKLLIIDDDLAHLNLLQTSLQKEYTVITASSGEKGIAAAADGNPDLILLDVSMPGLDGYEVCKRLKAGSETRHIPIIFVTAQTDGDNEYKGLALGAVDYIFKPFNIRMLNDKISALLKFNAMRDELRQKIEEQQKTITELKQDILDSEGRKQNKDAGNGGRKSEDYRYLEQEKQNLISIVNTIDDIISIQDMNSKIIWTNKAAMKQFGVTYAELQGKKCYAFYYGRDTPCSNCYFADPANENAGGPVEVTMDRLGAQYLRTSLPLPDSKGKTAGVACTAQLQGASERGGSTEEKGDLSLAGDYATGSYSEFNDAVSTLLVSSDAICNMYRDDKKLARLNEYISDASTRLRTIFNELRKRAQRG